MGCGRALGLFAAKFEFAEPEFAGGIGVAAEALVGAG